MFYVPFKQPPRYNFVRINGVHNFKVTINEQNANTWICEQLEDLVHTHQICIEKWNENQHSGRNNISTHCLCNYVNRYKIEKMNEEYNHKMEINEEIANKWMYEQLKDLINWHQLCIEARRRSRRLRGGRASAATIRRVERNNRAASKICSGPAAADGDDCTMTAAAAGSNNNDNDPIRVLPVARAGTRGSLLPARLALEHEAH
ncbi:unnamed protein product [Trichogramma brassicae]|uniref:Uncharacterized protein n=1 Tax=Trichogramma brassicae TaxID=86971 RepID=A0A6H5J8A7_9HYME|nr:unnamed protein product [Trichogramma brassicae]